MILGTFIEGIEVLDKTEIWDMSLLGKVITCLIYIIAIIIGSIIDSDGEHLILITVMSTIIALIFGLLLFWRPTGGYEYKVTIDNTVSLTEFYEKYRIVCQEGKIYTIKLKEEEFKKDN